MHRGLQILELIELICAQVGTDGVHPLSKDESRDLSVLARTSKAFLNPALNVLWRHQDTIVNLLKCMPADLWDISTGPNDEEWPESILSIVSTRYHAFVRAH